MHEVDVHAVFDDHVADDGGVGDGGGQHERTVHVLRGQPLDVGRTRVPDLGLVAHLYGEDLVHLGMVVGVDGHQQVGAVCLTTHAAGGVTWSGGPWGRSLDPMEGQSGRILGTWKNEREKS